MDFVSHTLSGSPFHRFLDFPRIILLILLLALGLPMLGTAYAQELGQQRISRAERVNAYRARADSLINFFATRFGPEELSRGGYIDVIAKLYRGQDLDWVMARLDTLMQDPRGDMFWMYPFTTAMFVGRDVLPEDYRARMRDLWRTYTPYRGDTENHWAMYYASLYLVTQMYPDDPPESWFTGKSSAENHAEAREYLIDWIDLTTTIGQGEYDSPTYIAFYLTPMAMLYAFAEDPAMKQRAAMMLDYLVADFAVENLDGLYAGAFSRAYPGPLLDRWSNNSTSFAWLFFGNVPMRPYGATLIVAVSGYEPPAVIYHIGTDRSAPYVHRELKRTRHRIRNSDVRNAPVYKTTYMHPDYAVGSSQGGLLQPIQQHTWEVLWATDDPQAGYNMLFTVHPYWSAFEGTMYFAEPWQMVTELIVRSKKEYSSPWKWTGGSPYEQVMQHEDAVIALYEIPPEAQAPDAPYADGISAFFSGTLVHLEEDDSGWLFAQGGEALIAYYPLAAYQWRAEPEPGTAGQADWPGPGPVLDALDDAEPGTHLRLGSPHLKNGAVVQVAPASAYPDMNAFKEAVRALPLETATEPVPRVHFTTLRGAVLEATYGETPTVNGEPLAYDDWPLYDGPFLHAEKDSRTLEMRYGPLRRLLDFERVTITDGVAESETSTMSMQH